jgi:hypothetical protein
MVGGNLQQYLPMKGGVVTCACIKLDLNPGAPAELLVGTGPQRIRSAERAARRERPIPVFLKRGNKIWEYVGKWTPFRFDAGMPVDRADIAGTLHMRPAE